MLNNNKIGWRFDNTYSKLPGSMLTKLVPTPVKAPKLVILNHSLSKVLGLNLAHGGHLTHGSKVNFSGQLYDFISYNVDKNTGTINFEEVLKIAIEKQTKGKFTVVNGTVEIDGETLPKSLSDKLLEFVDNMLETGPLERFWDNLKENPTQSAREDLFSFLEANRVALTVDGCFIAYKKVRDDWWDSYTGKTYKNVPGTLVKMDRDKVDSDRRNTCSAGLHVAAWEYASGFTGNRIVEVKVNPRDVVAVPEDYQNQKMRVCQYLKG